jgi:Immunoglobulin domain
VPGPAVINADPQDQSAFQGQNATFSVGVAIRSGPYFYQWQFNGTNIVGATGSTLTLTNVSSANVGSYSVMVSNYLTSAISGSAGLTLTPAPRFTSSGFLPAGAGFQLDFTGPSGMSYSLWTSTDVSLKPVRDTWTLLNLGTFSGATDTFTDSAASTNHNQFYILTMP